MNLFRAMWPITDPDAPLSALLADAGADLPALARRSRVELVGIGQYCIARSSTVPGSGNLTEWTLLYSAPSLPATDPDRNLDTLVIESMSPTARLLLPPPDDDVDAGQLSLLLDEEAS